MITDANGMPVLQPEVDDASTATFNAAFAQIGTVTSRQQIKTYKWANAAARTEQTGMSDGDLGTQLDTDTLYQYTGTAWVVAGLKTIIGSVSIPSTGGGSTAPIFYSDSIAITFPAGTFTTAPKVFFSYEGTGVGWASGGSIATTLTTSSARAFRVGAAPSGAVSWMAVGA